MAVPSRAGRDDAAVRGRFQEIAHRSAGQVIEAIEELGSTGLVPKTSVECRVVNLPMMFKLYLLNDEEVFFGFYPVVEREVPIDGKDMPIFDAVGKDTVLFHHSVSDDDRATGSQYVDQARLWFNSLWGTISRTHNP
ncbi:hypothetical protein AB0E69_33890 [Kribbella sp. NPDC026611]|uniref:hypothetical protein n=1 Tax=Kribbella sp. NPDC026611 TaxID=3154911 RepID=UPI00340B22EF